MNWYKFSQNQLFQQYDLNLKQPAVNINITGSGVNQVVEIPGGKPISVKDLLNKAVNKIRPVLTKNNVREINTDKISNPNAQGLAKSNTPGVVYIDVAKIVSVAKSSLPSVTQLDGANQDPDIINSISEKVSSLLLGELGETALHESFHSQQFHTLYQQGKPFSEATEDPAEQFGKSQRKTYFSDSLE